MSASLHVHVFPNGDLKRPELSDNSWESAAVSPDLKAHQQVQVSPRNCGPHRLYRARKTAKLLFYHFKLELFNILLS